MAAEEDSQVLVRPKPLFSWKNLFIPFLVLALFMAILISFFLPAKEAKPQVEQERLDFAILESRPEDQTGRTVVYSERSLFDGIGRQGRSYQGNEYLVGRVAEWTKDAGLSLRLEDGSEYKIAQASDGIATTFLVEDLSVSYENNPSSALVPIGAVGVVLRDIDVEFLVQPGDVAAVILPENFEEGQAVAAVVLRRFGGSAQLEKELGFELQTPPGR